jgi:LuxR family maltose regulon positive regulatory protein
MISTREAVAGSSVATVGDDLPHQAHHHVRRRRLDERFDSLRAPGPRLLGLWAAAGAGKTTAMTQWARQLEAEGERVFWFSGATGSADAALLRAQSGAPGADASATDASERLTYVFVDDVQLISSPLTRAQVSRMLRSTNTRLRLILAGRWEPFAIQAVLRSSGDMIELRADELAFTSAEASELAAQHELSLSAEALEMLVARTGGWATGLALAMPWLHEAANPDRAVTQFDGDNRAVADYLVSEIVENLSEADREVLMASAVRPVVPLELAITLTGRNDAGAVLRRLSRRNTLITEEAGDLSYRYHPVLLAFMQAEAWRRDSLRAGAGHDCAAVWFAGRGDGASALEQAVLSRRTDLIGEMLSRFGVELVAVGRSTMVVRALRSLKGVPDTLASLVVRLLLDAPYFADARLADNLVAAARSRLGTAASNDTPAPGGTADSPRWAALLSILQAFRATGRDRLIAQLQLLDSPAVEAARRADLAVDLLAATAAGWCLSALKRLPEAETMLIEVSQTAKAAGYEWLFLLATDLASAAASRNGHWMLASTLEAQVVDIARSSTSLTDRRSARATLLLLIRAYEHGEPVSMSALEKLSNPDAAGADFGVIVPASTLQLLVALDGGANPRVNLDRLSRLMVETGAGHPRTLSACCVHLYDLSSTLDGRTEARAIVRLVESALGEDSLESELLRLVSAPSVRAHEPAELALEAALAHSRYSWRGSTVVSAWLALAQVAENTHRRADAEARLIMALRIGEQLGLERPFLNFGGQGAALVQSRWGRLGALNDFADRVVSRARERNPEASVDVFGAAHGLLTHREHELLRELPLHQTVIEIAAKQNVSANTAKTHLRSIYSKLGASDRAQAVAIARERGLL